MESGRRTSYAGADDGDMPLIVPSGQEGLLALVRDDEKRSEQSSHESVVQRQHDAMRTAVHVVKSTPGRSALTPQSPYDLEGRVLEIDDEDRLCWVAGNLRSMTPESIWALAILKKGWELQRMTCKRVIEYTDIAPTLDLRSSLDIILIPTSWSTYGAISSFWKGQWMTQKFLRW